MAESLERFGHIDVWVNNVGQGITRAPSQLTDEDIDEIMRVNAGRTRASFLIPRAPRRSRQSSRT